MYHIKNDKRSQDSANRIYQSLRHVLLNKSLDDITITDIFKESGISRMTFYRLFDNINDVLAYKIHFFIEEYKKLVKDKSDKLLFFFEYWSKHRDLIKILNESATIILLNEFFQNKDSTYDIYKTTIKSTIMASILSKWSLRNGKETPLEMKKLVLQILNEGSLLLVDF